MRPDDTDGFECHAASTAHVAVEDMFRTDESEDWQTEHLRQASRPRP